MQKLYQTSVHFITKVVPTGFSVGIVTFSNSAFIRAHLKDMTSQNARNDMVKKVPRFAGGATAIGLGLLAGVEVLIRGVFINIRAGTVSRSRGTDTWGV